MLWLRLLPDLRIGNIQGIVLSKYWKKSFKFKVYSIFSSCSLIIMFHCESVWGLVMVRRCLLISCKVVKNKFTRTGSFCFNIANPGSENHLFYMSWCIVKKTGDIQGVTLKNSVSYFVAFYFMKQNKHFVPRILLLLALLLIQNLLWVFQGGWDMEWHSYLKLTIILYEKTSAK